MKTAIGDNIRIFKSNNQILFGVTLSNSDTELTYVYTQLTDYLSNLLTRVTYCSKTGIFTNTTDLVQVSKDSIIDITFNIGSVEKIVPIYVLPSVLPTEKRQVQLLLTRVVANIDAVAESVHGILADKKDLVDTSWTEIG